MNNNDRSNAPIQKLNTVAFEAVAAPIPEPAQELNLFDRLFAFAAPILMLLLARAVPIGKNPLGTMIVLLLLFTFGAFYLHFKGAKFKIRHYIFLGIAAVFCISMITGAGGFIRSLTFFGLCAAYLAWLYDAAGLAGARLKSHALPSHIVKAVFINPFMNMWAIFKGFAGSGVRDVRTKNVLSALGWAALGLVVTVIPTTVIAVLLSYDQQFTSLMSDIFSFDGDTVGEWILDILLTIPLSMLLFSAVYTVGTRMKRGEEELLNTGKVAVVPRSLLFAAVTPILILYVIFFISQWTYFLSAFSGVLPDGLTYAEYARSGFFDLCAVCSINAVLLFLFCTFIKRREDGRTGTVSRIYAAIISLFSMVLVAIALSKMFLYIDYYGLTPNRVYSSWFILLLALAFIVIFIGQIIRKFPAAAVGLVGAVALFALLSVPNVDSMIANYNVDKYLEGELREIDVETLDSLGLSSVPARVRLEEELSEKGELTEYELSALEAVKVSLDTDATELMQKKGTFFSFSFTENRARRLLEDRVE